MKRSIIITALLAFAINSPLAYSAESATVPAGVGTLAPADMGIATAAFMEQDSSADAASPWDSATGVFAERTLVVTVILISIAGIVANAAAATGTSGT